ncbi:MAG TPA: DivIVA domain-containing protein [Solirubrobacterales bacterium]|nr:DivIVA domain-containing protein [Solirubrobacterales bacterium]
MGVDQTSLDRIRNATFPSSRRGYDKHEVEKFLGRLADWLETGGGDESRSDVVKKELQRVGERTGAILAQAEDSAQQIRAEAEEEARGTINSANLQATEARAEADNYVTETRASADRQAREAIEQAQAQARRIVEEANQRREDMEALIGDLVRRREDVISDTEQLSRKLADAVEQHRSEELQMPEPLPDPVDEGAAETRGEPESDEMTTEPESEEMPTEPESDELPIEPESEETRVAAASQETQEHSITTGRDAPSDPQETEEHETSQQTRPEHQDLRT